MLALIFGILFIQLFILIADLVCFPFLNVSVLKRVVIFFSLKDEKIMVNYGFKKEA